MASKVKKQLYIEWELEQFPDMYKEPRCDEFIDRQTLTHVICNVDCPEGVEFDAFEKIVSTITETLERFPYFKISFQGRGLHDGADHRASV